MKIFKLIGIIILSIVAILVLLFALLGFSILGGAYSLIQEGNQEVIQEVKYIDNKVNIKVPLYEKLGIQYTDIKICSEKEKDDMFFKRVELENGVGLSSDLFCANDICTISIDLDDLGEIPKNLYLHVKNDEDICQKTKSSIQEHIVPLQYTSKIEFTEELKNLMSIAPDDKYEISSSHNSGTLIYQVMGTKKVVFSYNEKITEDTLLIDSDKKANILFDFVPYEKDKNL